MQEARFGVIKKSACYLMLVFAVASLLVGTPPVHASICEVLNITPNYPSEAGPFQEIAIDVNVTLNCSPFYSYSYMIVRVDLMPIGVTRIIATEVVRAYPYLSSETVHVLVFTPKTMGPWYLNVVITVVDIQHNSRIDSITGMPVVIQVGPPAPSTTVTATTQIASTVRVVQTSTTTATQMLIIVATSMLGGLSMAPDAQDIAPFGIVIAACVVVAILVLGKRGKSRPIEQVENSN
jgi:hypothetical protein